MEHVGYPPISSAKCSGRSHRIVAHGTRITRDLDLHLDLEKMKDAQKAIVSNGQDWEKSFAVFHRPSPKVIHDEGLIGNIKLFAVRKPPTAIVGEISTGIT